MHVTGPASEGRRQEDMTPGRFRQRETAVGACVICWRRPPWRKWPRCTRGACRVKSIGLLVVAGAKHKIHQPLQGFSPQRVLIIANPLQPPAFDLTECINYVLLEEPTRSVWQCRHARTNHEPMRIELAHADIPNAVASEQLWAPARLTKRK